MVPDFRAAYFRPGSIYLVKKPGLIDDDGDVCYRASDIRLAVLEKDPERKQHTLKITKATKGLLVVKEYTISNLLYLPREYERLNYTLKIRKGKYEPFHVWPR
nr:MAG TPA: hypothetical protein [Caudoviricetes sp.]